MTSKKLMTLLAGGALSLAISGAAHAATTGATFLKIDVGARGAGMGGAFGAVAEGPEGMWVNPAAVALAKGKSAMVMHNSYIGDINQEYLGYMQEGKGASWGLSYMTMDLGSQGAFSPTNVALGSFTPSDQVLTIGYGRKFNKRMAGGVSLKYIKSEISTFSDSTFGLDVGVVYKMPGQPLRLGAALQNLGQGLELGAGQDDLPTLLRVSAAYKVPKTEWLVAMEGEFSDGSDPVWKLGTEYTLSDLVTVRAGYNNSSDLDSGYTYGLGLNQKNYKFNYAYIPFGTFGNTHRFALDVKW